MEKHKPNTQCKLMALRGWWASSSQGYSLPGFPAVNVAMGRSFFCVSCQNERLLSSVWHLTLLLSDTTSMSPAPPNKTVVFVGGFDMPFSPHYSIFNHKTRKTVYYSLAVSICSTESNEKLQAQYFTQWCIFWSTLLQGIYETMGVITKRCVLLISQPSPINLLLPPQTA